MFIAAAIGAGKTRPELINNTDNGTNGINAFKINSAHTVKSAASLFRLAINSSNLLNQS